MRRPNHARGATTSPPDPAAGRRASSVLSVSGPSLTDVRILHTSDWHLGRSLHRADLRDAQAGFLDGRHGLVLCTLQAYGVFLKWAKLWEWRRFERNGWHFELPAYDDSDQTWEGTPATAAE